MRLTKLVTQNDTGQYTNGYLLMRLEHTLPSTSYNDLRYPFNPRWYNPIICYSKLSVIVQDAEWADLIAKVGTITFTKQVFARFVEPLQ